VFQAVALGVEDGIGQLKLTRQVIQSAAAAKVRQGACGTIAVKPRTFDDGPCTVHAHRATRSCGIIAVERRAFYVKHRVRGRACHKYSATSIACVALENAVLD